MDKIETLSQFIDKIGQLPDGQYVFRGVSNIDYPIEASTYRRLKDKNGEFINEGDHTAERLLQLNQEMIDDANLHRHGWINEQPMSDLNLLSELQHKGAATCLIDFTKNPLVALWMACREGSKGSTDGKVFVIDISSHLEYKPVSVEESMSIETKIEAYFETDQKTGYQLYQWQPNYQNSRMRAQQSIFLFGGGAGGITESEKFIIDKDSKESIRKFLKKCASITGDILFPDIEGFASHRADSKSYYAEDDNQNIPLSEAYLEKARKAASEGKDDEAIDFLNYGLANQPTEEIKRELYKEIAIRYYNKGDKERTIYYCTELIGLGVGDMTSTDNIALILRGQSQFELGQHHRAIASFDTAIQINPKDKEAHYWRGMANIECYEYEQAITDFDKASEIDKEDPTFYHWRGVAKYHLDQYDDAIDDLTLAIDLKIADLPTYYYRGMAYYEKEKDIEARSNYNMAIHKSPKDPFIYYARGLANMRSDRVNDAKSDFQLALIYAENNNNTSLVEKINSKLEDINSDSEDINSDLEKNKLELEEDNS